MPLQSRPHHSCPFAKRRRARRGFTLPELMTALGILSLLLLGTVSVFILVLRLSASVSGASLSSQDASNAIQRITTDLREANSFALLDDAAHDATDANGHVIVTGITITFPQTYTSPVSSDGKYYTGGAGVSKGPLAGTDVPYNVAGASSTVTFYRANWQQTQGADGTPNPSSGNCLWVSGMENGQTVSGPVIKTLAPNADAVQFVVPRQADGVTPVSNVAEIKIVSGQYDPIHGTASSESAAGSTVALTGECVYLRDHNPSPVAPGGSNGKRIWY